MQRTEFETLSPHTFHHSVKSMAHMFNNAETFDQNVHFDTSSVDSMNGMFHRARAFDKAVSFDTSAVTEMAGMFAEADSLHDCTKQTIQESLSASTAWPYN
jgi:hypothetical protein